MKTYDDKKKSKGSDGITHHLSATVFKSGLVPAKVIQQSKGKPMLSCYRGQISH